MREEIKEEVIKMAKNNISTKNIALHFNVSQRSAQKWLKELGLNRTVKQACKINKKFNKVNKKLNKVNKPPKNTKFKNVKGNYALYRFIDKNDKIIYVGKCEKSIISNGHGGKREYFLKDRITAHFAPSCKHLPKAAYLSVSRIEYALCKTKDELLSLEEDLILFYKMNNKCVWNGQMPLKFNNKYNFLTINWKKYHEFKRTL